GSDVGLLLSSLAVSRIGDMEPARVGYINLFGVAGALAGAAIGVLVPVHNNIQKGTLFGTTAALAAGTLLTGVLGLGKGDDATPLAALDHGAARRAAYCDSLGLTLPDSLPEITM